MKSITLNGATRPGGEGSGPLPIPIPLPSTWPIDHPAETVLTGLTILLAFLGFVEAWARSPAVSVYALPPPADPASSQLPALVTLAALAIKCAHSYLMERLRLSAEVRDLRRKVAEFEGKPRG